MANEARRDMEAGLQEVQDACALTLALAAVKLHQGDIAWLDRWLVALGENVLAQMARHTREIH